MSLVPMTPGELLGRAHDLLTSAPASMAGRWPRAVAILCRQALEGSVEELWRSRGVHLGWANERAQMLCLPAYLGDPGLAARAYAAWSSLSRACHQHAYDLSPTGGELAGWLATVDEVRRAVEKQPKKAKKLT
jgi:hypothetical protein